MSNGYSLHIGLNRVDPNAYSGWDGKLSGCENDANAMQDICIAQGFQTRLLLTNQATSNEVLSAISELATHAASSDTVVISYSGHGGQVPDTTGTEVDGLCETWVCYDRQVVDKELYARWSEFKRNVHVEVYSDSCHSGTVIRELILDINVQRDLPEVDGIMQSISSAASARRAALQLRGTRVMLPAKSVGAAAYRAVYAPKVKANPAFLDRELQFQRMIPPSLAYKLFREQPVLQQQPKPGPLQCGVVLISGCQDNQTSADGQTNGLFTEKLLAVWDHGAFSGTIPQFHRAILALMPADQTPNYDLVGIDDDAISNGRPLSVLDNPAEAAVGPQIGAPATAMSDGPAPVFQLTIGAGRSGIVEVATDVACFADERLRTADNFYGSWSDGARLHDGAYTLPEAVWRSLGGAPKLYYRAGSATGESGWDDYCVSTPDGQVANSPFIALQASYAGDDRAPKVTGPTEWSRSSETPPTLTISTSAPYHVVELATDPNMFASDSGRNNDNFYATWQDQPLLTDASFEMPEPTWYRLRSAQRVYYRGGSTTSAAGWDNYRVSTPDDEAVGAPFIALTD